MATATKTGVKRTIERVKGAVSDVNYAQRRLFEIRTGVPVSRPDRSGRPAGGAEELESLHELDRADKLAA